MDSNKEFTNQHVGTMHKIPLNCFQGLNVLILGDVILDHYLMGRVERISPEAPVPVLLHEQERYCLGGAANVALNIQSLGGTPYLLSLVGNDAAATTVHTLLEEEGIATDYLLKDEKRPTSLKTRLMARNQQLLRYDRESTAWIDEVQEGQILEQVHTLLSAKKIQALVFQDYNKGLLTAQLIQQVIQLAKKHKVPTLADPKKLNFEAYRGIDWFKPNLRETREALQMDLRESPIELGQLQLAGERLNALLSNQTTLITLGAAGIYAHQKVEVLSQVWPTKARPIADVCGAGDTVIAVVALGVAAHWDLDVILKLANIGGGQVCEAVGVVSVKLDQLLEEYNKQIEC